MHPFSAQLRAAVETSEPLLLALAESGRTGSRWSPKEELGHLIDSATNNRVRFIRAALDGNFTGPSYDGPRWVEMGGYADTPWFDLVQTWVLLNRALTFVIDRIPSEGLSALVSLEAHETVTLEFLVADYLRHMQHHLDHILGRKTE